MNATFGGYNPAQYMHRSNGLRDMGMAIGSAISNIPAAIRYGEQWQDERNARTATEAGKERLFQEVKILSAQMGDSLPEDFAGRLAYNKGESLDSYALRVKNAFESVLTDPQTGGINDDLRNKLMTVATRSGFGDALQDANDNAILTSAMQQQPQGTTPIGVGGAMPQAAEVAGSEQDLFTPGMQKVQSAPRQAPQATPGAVNDLMQSFNYPGTADGTVAGLGLPPGGAMPQPIDEYPHQNPNPGISLEGAGVLLNNEYLKNSRNDDWIPESAPHQEPQPAMQTGIGGGAVSMQGENLIGGGVPTSDPFVARNGMQPANPDSLFNIYSENYERLGNELKSVEKEMETLRSRGRMAGKTYGDLQKRADALSTKRLAIAEKMYAQINAPKEPAPIDEELRAAQLDKLKAEAEGARNRGRAALNRAGRSRNSGEEYNNPFAQRKIQWYNAHSSIVSMGKDADPAAVARSISIGEELDAAEHIYIDAHASGSRMTEPQAEQLARNGLRTLAVLESIANVDAIGRISPDEKLNMIKSSRTYEAASLDVRTNINNLILNSQDKPVREIIRDLSATLGMK